MTLKETLLQANAKLAEDNAEFERERLEKISSQVIKAFVTLFGFEPDTVNGSECACEGITFRVNREEGNYYFRIQGICPECAAQVWSTSVWGNSPTALGELGSLLENFTADFSLHHCSVFRRDELMPAERLVELIREIAGIPYA